MERRTFKYAKAQVLILGYIAVAITANLVYFVGRNNLNWW